MKGVKKCALIKLPLTHKTVRERERKEKEKVRERQRESYMEAVDTE